MLVLSVPNLSFSAVPAAPERLESVCLLEGQLLLDVALIAAAQVDVDRPLLSQRVVRTGTAAMQMQPKPARGLLAWLVSRLKKVGMHLTGLLCETHQQAPGMDPQYHLLAS